MKIRRNSWLLITSLLLLATFANTNAQQKTIAKTVVDASSNKPIEFVSVVALHLPDSAIVGGTITDSIGRFSIDKQADVLRFSAIGYCRDEFSVAALPDTIRLKPDAVALGEVKVTANLFRKEPGGIVAQVQGSPLDKLGTAIDVLKYVPFVNVKNDEISIVGRDKILIYINGRLVRDEEEIQRLNSSEIKQVYVITNPGAEYDATVGAVIKITTTKKQGDGLGGTADYRYTYRHVSSTRVTTKVNYRKGNFDLYFAPSTTYGNVAYDQTVSTQNDIISVEDNMYVRYGNRWLNIEGAMNKIFDEKNSGGITYKYSYNPYNSGVNKFHCDDRFVVNDKDSQRFESPITMDWNTYNNKSHYLNTYYIHDFNDKSSLNFSFDWTKGRSEILKSVDKYSETGKENLLTKSGRNYSLYAGKLVVNTTIANGDVQVGTEYSNVSNKQTYNIDYSDMSHSLENSDNNLRQHLIAGFVTYSHNIGSRINVSAGVRYEHLVYNYYEYDVKDDDACKIYDGFHPSAAIQYDGENVQIEFTYRNIITRPNFSALSSSISYVNPYCYEGGNPYLKPQYTNRFSISAMFSGVSIVADYNRQQSPFELTTTMLNGNDSIFYAQWKNVLDYDYFLIAASYHKKIGLWSPTIDIQWYKQNLEYNGVKHSKPIFEASVENKFNVTDKLYAGCDFTYNTKGDRYFCLYSEDWECDMYVIKTFLDGALTTKFQVDNVLNSSKYKRNGDYGGVRDYKETTEYDRRFVFQLTYKFNQSRSRYKGRAASNEINRL